MGTTTQHDDAIKHLLAMAQQFAAAGFEAEMRAMTAAAEVLMQCRADEEEAAEEA